MNHTSYSIIVILCVLMACPARIMGLGVLRNIQEPQNGGLRFDKREASFLLLRAPFGPGAGFSLLVPRLGVVHGWRTSPDGG